MIKRIVSFALHQPLFVVLMSVLFIGGGWVAFAHLPVEAFPDVSDIQVNVITLYPGRAPEEVEKQVTMPIETVLNGLPHLVRMFSHTQFGLSFIMLTFDDRTTDTQARQQTLDRLATADLPQGVQPHLARMRYYGISLQQLYSSLGRGNANVGGSKVTHGSQQHLIRGVGLLRSPDEINSIVIAAHNGTPILVKDIAAVTIGNVPIEGIMGQDDTDDVVSGIVLMRKGENPSRVLEALKQKIQLLNASILPKGAKIVPYYDRTWLIETTLKTVFKNLAEGAMLVTFVLFLFLGNLRAAAIVALIIPLSLLATFIGLTWRGIPANLLSLGAMDFGIIVDGAVIVVENVFRRLGELKDVGNWKTRLSTIEHATVEVGRPTFFSMLIIIAAHIPIFTLQRHEGRIFAPMAWTVTSALVGSLLF